MKKEIKMWIGVDPDAGEMLTWSLGRTRSICRANLDNMCWGAARVYRVTLTLSPPKRGRGKK